MKTAWYGNWIWADDSRINDPDYINLIVSNIKDTIISSFEHQKFILDKQQIVKSKCGPLLKDTIAWKGHFVFESESSDLKTI